MANTYDLGDLIRLSTLFAADPTIVSLKVRNPAGTISTYSYPASVSRLATGSYYKDIFMNDVGQWWYRWEASGTLIVAEESYFTVSPSEF